ncbi:MAG: hypothetical protein AAGD25_13375 [Cyanobacteria bacterium P01_F01_bin.150]
MHQHVVEIFQTLAKAGAVPGTDFSVDPNDGSLRMNQESYQILRTLYPDVEWEDVTDVVEPDLRADVHALHQHLGTNFVDELIFYIHERLSELPSSQAAWYLQQVLGGVQQRTGINLYDLLIQNIDISRFVYIESLFTGDVVPTPCHMWIGDLILSAGGTRNDFEFEDDDAMLTERGLRLLALVWAGTENLYDHLLPLDDSASES